jgi:hypothetical protein
MEDRAYCPKCDSFTAAQWKMDNYREEADRSQLFVKQAQCLHCGEPIVHIVSYQKLVNAMGETVSVTGFQDQRIWPRGEQINKPPKDTPETIAKDYTEAQLVLPNSVNASAALSRRCLQNLIRTHFEIVRDSLNQEIDALVEQVPTLPNDIKKDLDIIRQGGNVALHPCPDTSSMLDVTQEEAEFLLSSMQTFLTWVYEIHPRGEEHRKRIREKHKEGKKAVKEMRAEAQKQNEGTEIQ